MSETRPPSAAAGAPGSPADPPRSPASPATVAPAAPDGAHDASDARLHAGVDIARIDFAERKLLVLFGSQTGCAQALARRVGREARRCVADAAVACLAAALIFGTAHTIVSLPFFLLRSHLFDVEVIPMDSVQVSALPTTRLILFVCSTTGQGEVRGRCASDPSLCIYSMAILCVPRDA